MGLSTKQVINSISTSNHVFDWSQTLLPTQPLQLPKSSLVRKHQEQQEQQEQNHQQNSEQLKCPRCDSTNTKFCYYNNHNKSQPRHFCRSCKRHWTKGGTLRNVPIGGVRKNKNRNKKQSTSSAINSKNQTNGNIGNKLSAHMTCGAHKQKQSFSLDFNDEKSVSEVLYQSSLLPQQNNLIITSEPFTQNQITHFPNFHSSNSFDSSNDVCSVSTSLIQTSSSSFYNYVEEFEVMTEPAISRHVPTTTISLTQQPWQVPITSNSGMDMSNNWSCDDIDTLVSNDINLVWDYYHIKS